MVWKDAGTWLEIEKLREIASGARIRKVERTLRDAEILLDEPQDGAKVHAIIVHISHRRIGGDDDKGDAETILIVALSPGQEGGRFVIVPASPIVPGNEDGSVIPIDLVAAILALGMVADGIDDGSDPGWPAAQCCSSDDRNCSALGITQLTCARLQFWMSFSIWAV